MRTPSNMPRLSLPATPPFASFNKVGLTAGATRQDSLQAQMCGTGSQSHFQAALLPCMWMAFLRQASRSQASHFMDGFTWAAIAIAVLMALPTLTWTTCASTAARSLPQRCSCSQAEPRSRQRRARRLPQRSPRCRRHPPALARRRAQHLPRPPHRHLR